MSFAIDAYAVLLAALGIAAGIVTVVGWVLIWGQAVRLLRRRRAQRHSE